MRFAFIAFLFIVFVAPKPGHVEYYQYTDENGVTRFTDDLTNVPENIREKVEAFEEIKSTSGQQKFHWQKDRNTDADNGYSSASGQNDGTDAILKERAALKQRFEALEQEKKELEDDFKGSKDNKAIKEYNDRIRELNNKISEYEKDRKAFEKKVEDLKKQNHLF
jgi:predicted RNase H-like nuclease (RuvC/YqgF family)